MEYCPVGLKMSLLDSQLLHSVFVQDVDAAPAVYQHAGEAGSASVRCEGGFQDNA